MKIIRVTLDIEVPDGQDPVNVMRALRKERDKVSDFVSYVLMDKEIKTKPHGAYAHGHEERNCSYCHSLIDVPVLERA